MIKNKRLPFALNEFNPMIITIMKKARLILPLFLIFFMISCGDNEDYADIPYVRVNFTINPASIEYG